MEDRYQTAVDRTECALVQSPTEAGGGSVLILMTLRTWISKLRQPLNN